MQDLLRLVIVEDEEDAIQLLSNLVKDYCPEFTLIGIAKNVEESVILINDTVPDVLMLDVTLGNNNCFDVLKQLNNLDFHLVFTTAYAEYALEAFQYNAVHYLLKPYSISEVRKAVDKVKDSEIVRRSKKDANKLIKIPTNDGNETIKLDEVLYIHAARSYSTLYTIDKTYVLSKSLGEIENEIQSEKFLRCHHSYLVNVKYIVKLKKTDNIEYIILTNGIELPVSRRKKEEVLKNLKTAF
jgi:two-component system, LytTR family, response regulator